MKKSVLVLTALLVVGGVAFGESDLRLEKATFAGGCFWCMESAFEEIKGVKEAVSGYTGGQKENPTYEQVCSGATGHREAVEITFDPKEISYEALLDIFWHNIDPTDAGGQFADRGEQYRAAIYYHNEEQRKIAEASKEKLNKSGAFNKPVITEILPAAAFYKAEEHHQNYCRLNPVRYKLYRYGSGREQFLEKAWGKTDKAH